MNVRKIPSCLRLTAVFAVLVCVAGYAQTQSRMVTPPTGYPEKPIRLLVGNAPGGGSDTTARTVAQKLSETLGRSVIVDNRPGAAGIIAMNLAAQATPDGYTLLLVAGSDLAGAMVQKKLSYDVRTAYAPISRLTSQYYLLLVTPLLPVNSVQDLIAYAKNKPGTLSFGSAGVGSTGHAGLEFLKSTAAVDIVHVPYKGIGPALIDMMSGQLHLAFASTISGAPHVKSGRLRALAVTSLRRTEAFPELPSVSEAGVSGFDLTNWYGVFGPAGTPQVIVLALHREIRQALASPDVRARFASSGAEVAPSVSPAEFGDALSKEVDKWEKIMKIRAFAESLR